MREEFSVGGAIMGDVRVGMHLLRQEALKILMITLLFSAIGILIAIYTPNRFQATITVVPSEESSGAGMLERYSSIARLAGLSLPSGGSSKSNSYSLQILQSDKFLRSFILEAEIKPMIMAMRGGNFIEPSVKFDPDLYDKVNNIWKSENGVNLEPSLYETVIAFRENLKITQNPDTGLITISVTHFSPIIAAEWCNDLIKHLNFYIRNDKVSEVEASIDYINKKIQDTNIQPIAANLNSLLQDQLQELMLVNSREEYAFRVIDPAYLPEERYSPSRSKQVMFASLLGCLVGFFVSFLLKKKY